MIAVESPKVKFSNARIVGEGVNPEDHHKQEHARGTIGYVMSRGELMKFNLCPTKWMAGIEEEQTFFMQWGDLVDCLYTATDQFDSRFAVAPEHYTVTMMQCPNCKSVTDSQSCRKCRKERVPIAVDKTWDWNATYCSEWRAAQNGKTVIKFETRQSAQKALQKLLDCPELADAAATAQFQVSISAEYFDPKTELSIPIRALVDIAPTGGDCGNTLLDLKTTNSAEPRAWARKVFSDHLDAQAALYLDLWHAATGEERSDFRHIVQESEPPYHVELRIMSQEFLELGRIKYRSALLKYCQCLATGIWPGYDNSKTMTFGRWALCSPEAWMIGEAA